MSEGTDQIIGCMLACSLMVLDCLDYLIEGDKALDPFV